MGTPPAVAASLKPLDAGSELEMLAYGEVEIVSTYGAPQAEYAAIRKACGLMDCAQRGVLVVGGKDRHSFLNNFLTNQTWSKETKQGMAAGTGVYAYLLNGKGRVVADMNVLETGEEIWIETDRRLVASVRGTLEKYVFTEKVTFSVPSVRVVGLLGPGGLGVLQEQGVVISELGQMASRWVTVFGVKVLAFRDDVCGVPGYFLLMPEAASEGGAAEKVWKGLAEPYSEQTNKRSLRPVGWAMFNACRVEAGRPVYGIDFTDQSLPAETGQFDRAVSVTKGCYLGQEIVARMHARQQVAKLLVGLRVKVDALPAAGVELHDMNGAVVGTVTSSTVSPILGGACIALATVRKGHEALGTILKVGAEGKVVEAEVVQLPFLK